MKDDADRRSEFFEELMLLYCDIAITVDIDSEITLDGHKILILRIAAKLMCVIV